MPGQNTLSKMTDSSGTGVLFEIERYATHDGPGIRTVVFLKGCPLNCRWCFNPESQKIKPQLIYWKNKCLSCYRCIDVCPVEALSKDTEGIVVDREKCTTCGRCTIVCNAEAIVLWGYQTSVEKVLEDILKDEQFYKNSDGGVTFSGGEPFHQTKFLRALSRFCKDNYIHTCVETSGYVPWKRMEQVILYLDLFLYDFKAMNNVRHKKLTGVSNEIILENFKRLVKAGKKVIVRVPVVPGLNDDEENYRMLSDFLNRYAPGNKIDLLPYHRMGISKYHWLDIDYTLEGLEPPSKERMEDIKKMLVSSGFEVSIDR